MPGGFCETYGGTDGAEIGEDLGGEWDIVTDMAIKLVPGSHFNHATAEAAALAAKKVNAAPDEIARIILSRPGMKKLAGPRHPGNLIDMAHSTAYFLAAAVADRDFGWAHAAQAKIDDPVIHQLIDKTEVGAEPTENVAAYRQGATVIIETVAGDRYEETVLVPNGAGCRGIDWADIDAKYHALAPAALGAAEIAESLEVIHAFDTLADISRLTSLLR